MSDGCLSSAPAKERSLANAVILPETEAQTNPALERVLDVRRYFFEILAITLIAGSMFFFYECILFLSRRDYVGAIILALIGLTVIRAGSEMARLTILEKR